MSYQTISHKTATNMVFIIMSIGQCQNSHFTKKLNNNNNNACSLGVVESNSEINCLNQKIDEI